jgi:hypothetical protein
MKAAVRGARRKEEQPRGNKKKVRRARRKEEE